jgi:hypothetical protein
MHYTNTNNLIDFPKDNTMTDLTDAVIKLHDVARTIEKQIGTGQLSDDIRQCADRLNDLIKKR